jgi:membrane protein YdbS with pleckstrin-like domain
MNPSEFVIRKSPFVFLKRVAVLIFFFALLPTLVALALNLRGEYQESFLARIVPEYTLFVVLLLALVQFLLVVLAFTSWYLPVYLVDGRRIVRKGGALQDDKLVADLSAVGAVASSQGPLGRRLDYGDLALSDATGVELATIKDIPNPEYYAAQISSVVELARTRQAASQPQSARELIAAGEGQFVEFKASLMWDYYRQAVNKDLYEPVMKNLAAFMNTAGGVLLIGVSDAGEVLGLERDFAALPKKNVDGFENVFNMAFNSMIGAEWRQYVSATFEDVEDKTVCVLSVTSASAPVYLTFKGKEEFYIRAGNASQPLTVSQATRFISLNFAGSPKNL